MIERDPALVATFESAKSAFTNLYKSDLDQKIKNILPKIESFVSQIEESMTDAATYNKEIILLTLNLQALTEIASSEDTYKIKIDKMDSIYSSLRSLASVSKNPKKKISPAAMSVRPAPPTQTDKATVRPAEKSDTPPQVEFVAKGAADLPDPTPTEAPQASDLLKQVNLSINRTKAILSTLYLEGSQYEDRINAIANSLMVEDEQTLLKNLMTANEDLNTIQFELSGLPQKTSDAPQKLEDLLSRSRNTETTQSVSPPVREEPLNPQPAFEERAQSSEVVRGPFAEFDESDEESNLELERGEVEFLDTPLHQIPKIKTPETSTINWNEEINSAKKILEIKIKSDTYSPLIKPIAQNVVSHIDNIQANDKNYTKKVNTLWDHLYSDEPNIGFMRALTSPKYTSEDVTKLEELASNIVSMDPNPLPTDKQAAVDRLKKNADNNADNLVVSEKQTSTEATQVVEKAANQEDKSQDQYEEAISDRNRAIGAIAIGILGFVAGIVLLPFGPVGFAAGVGLIALSAGALIGPGSYALSKAATKLNHYEAAESVKVDGEEQSRDPLVKTLVTDSTKTVGSHSTIHDGDKGPDFIQPVTPSASQTKPHDGSGHQSIHTVTAPPVEGTNPDKSTAGSRSPSLGNSKDSE